MSRIPELSRKDLSQESRIVYDEIIATRGEVDTPFQILLSTPELLRRVAHLGQLMRYESNVAPSIRECVILAAAREMNCEFEWAGHVTTARELGVSEETIESIRNGDVPNAGDESIQIVVTFVQESIRNHAVSDEIFARLQAAFGIEGTTEVCVTLGYYTMLAILINAFDESEIAAVAPAAEAPKR